MLPIIQGNDAIISVILHQQAIRLASSPADTAIESHKIDLSRVKELSVRLIPYMRWAEVSPEFIIRGNVLEVSFPASSQKPGKWDIEISYFAPADDGSYKRQQVKQDFAEVIPAYERAPGAMTSAYIVTAEVSSVMRGETGLDAYQSALTRGLVTSEEEWIKLIKGPQGDPGTDGDPGKDAYTIYLETTKDDPPLTREQWANLNDFLLQLLFRLVKGREVQLTADDMTADLILKLDSLRREMAQALRSYGIDIEDTDGLERFVEVLKGGIVPTQTIYKTDQYYLSKDELLPPLKIWGGWDNPTLSDAFFQSKTLKRLPKIDGIERVISIYRMCKDDSMLSGSVDLPSLPLCTSAASAFYGCSSLESVTLGDMPVCTTFDDCFRGCASLGRVSIGKLPKVVNLGGLLRGCQSITEVTFGDMTQDVQSSNMFFGCEALVRVNGVLTIVPEGNTFNSCASLVEVRIKGASVDVDLRWSKKLSIESIRYLVDNAKSVVGKTITLSNQLYSDYREEMDAIGRQATAKGFTITYR